MRLRFYLIPVLLALLALLAVGVDTGPKVPAMNRLNVLFITVDDMNYDSVGVFGSPLAEITPNIDRLASEGMRFEHGHVTTAICQPARAVWMTGRYPHRNGAVGFKPIRKNVPTLLEALRDAGYYTGIFAKVPHVIPSRQKAWHKMVKGDELGKGRDPELYYQQTAEFLREAKAAGSPFFLMANSRDPHRPFAGSVQEQERWRKAKNPEHPGVSRTYDPAEIPLPGFLPGL